MSADVEVVKRGDVVSRKRRQKEIERLDAAVAKGQEAKAETFDAMAEAVGDEVWDADDDWAHWRATHPDEHAELLARFNGWQAGVWLHWRYGYAVSYSAKLLAAGRARALLSSCTAVHELPQNESQARALSKAVNAKAVPSLGEQDDPAAQTAEVCRLWRQALKANNGDTAQAAKNFPRFARDSQIRWVADAYAGSQATQAGEDEVRGRRLAAFRQAVERMARWGLHADVRQIVNDVLP